MGCITGKRQYVNAIEAAQNLHRCKQLNRSERDYYRCKHCGRWHLTSQHRSTIGLTPDAQSGGGNGKLDRQPG